MTLWQDVIFMTYNNDIIWLWRWQQNVTKFVFLCDFANYMFVKIVRLFNLCYELSLKLIKFWKLAFFQNQLFIQNLIIDSIHKSCSTIEKFRFFFSELFAKFVYSFIKALTSFDWNQFHERRGNKLFVFRRLTWPLQNILSVHVHNVLSIITAICRQDF